MYQEAGFTLIELLIVVLIIGILVSVALPQYQTAVTKARLTELKSLVSSIKKAEELYYMANGEYTEEFENLDISLPGSANGTYWAPKTYITCSLAFIPRSIYCVNTSAGSLVSGWEVWLDRDPAAPHTLCYAYNNKTYAHRVCLAEGGKNPYSASHYTFYVIP
ncbi:MAG: type IV pilin protein [Candidatus Avelusimicrobium sp.]|uniref:type IV pilin protein n=1 Tax=Candidatus Avelusimicrobium sp. TaxID=3048833 RepID=UPI003F0A48A2